MKNVLVVDDNPIVRRHLRGLLERDGCVVVEAVDGDQALERLKQRHFDVMFLDLHMPNLDGAGVLHALGAKTKQLPVVLITSSESSAEIVAAFKQGARDYLLKPFREPQVRRAMQHATGLDYTTISRTRSDVALLDRDEGLAQLIRGVIGGNDNLEHATAMQGVPACVRQPHQLVFIGTLDSHDAAAEAEEAEAMGDIVAQSDPEAVLIRLLPDRAAELPEMTVFHAAASRDDEARIKRVFRAVRSGAVLSSGRQLRALGFEGPPELSHLYWWTLRRSLEASLLRLFTLGGSTALVDFSLAPEDEQQLLMLTDWLIGFTQAHMVEVSIVREPVTPLPPSTSLAPALMPTPVPTPAPREAVVASAETAANVGGGASATTARDSGAGAGPVVAAPPGSAASASVALPVGGAAHANAVRAPVAAASVSGAPAVVASAALAANVGGAALPGVAPAGSAAPSSAALEVVGGASASAASAPSVGGAASARAATSASAALEVVGAAPASAASAPSVGGAASARAATSASAAPEVVAAASTGAAPAAGWPTAARAAPDEEWATAASVASAAAASEGAPPVSAATGSAARAVASPVSTRPAPAASGSATAAPSLAPALPFATPPPGVSEGPATRVSTVPVSELMDGTTTRLAAPSLIAAWAPLAAVPAPPLPATPLAAPGAGLIIPGFELSSMVGEGGMSRVYRATQKSLRRQVCVKVMREEFAKDPALAERFHDEGIALAALRHPNIVSVLDVGRTEDGQLFMVMEYVDGGDLRAHLARVERVPVAETLVLVSQLLGGLAEAHASGIIHRDLKPSNVLLATLKDGSSLVKLVDFGIAKLLEGVRNRSGGTRQGTVVGTPGYMAPEQLLGMEVGPATDLYAVGVILFELITGRRPFVARDEFELAQLTMMTPVPHLHQILGEDVPQALDELIIGLLAKNPKDRPQSAAAVRVMLNAVKVSAAA